MKNIKSYILMGAGALLLALGVSFPNDNPVLGRIMNPTPVGTAPAVGDLNMAGYDITGVERITSTSSNALTSVNQVTITNDNASTTSPLLYIEGNGIPVGYSSGMVHMAYTGNNWNDGPLLFLDVQGSGNTQALWIRTATSSGTGNAAIYVDDQHDGNGLFIDKDSPGSATFIKQFYTNASSTSVSVMSDFIKRSVVTDGSTINNQGYVVRMTNAPRETSGTIVDTVKVLGLIQEHADATGDVLYFNNDGQGRSIFTDHDDTGTNASWELDRDGNNAAGIAGLTINVANAGAGNAYAAIFQTGYVGIGETTPAHLLSIKNTSSGYTNPLLFLNQDQNSTTFEIDTEASSADIATLDTVDSYTGNGLWVGSSADVYTSLGRGRAGSIATNVFYRNNSSAVTNGPVVTIQNGSSGDDQEALKVVQASATTTLSVYNSTATSSAYIYSGGAGLGGRLILEDTDGAGCTEVTALDGTLTAQVVTCP